VLLSVGTSYIVRIFIGRTGSIADVGLYSAGFSIVTMYVGMIFNAMATDFYPRLSAVSHDNGLCRQVINQQAEIAILILAPILLVFLVFINSLVIMLYSNQFIAINNMILWAALGMFFRAIVWSIAFLFLAKSKIKIYFWTEFASTIYTLLLNLIGYKFYGLTGLGISFFISYLISMVQVFFISKMKFSFFFEKAFIKIFFYQFILNLIALVCVGTLPQPYPYLIGIPLIVLSFVFSFKALDKRLDLRGLINKSILSFKKSK
jgi:O-antigen/teichoic acid export membrane protein